MYIKPPPTLVLSLDLAFVFTPFNPKCQQNHEALHWHSPFFTVNPTESIKPKFSWSSALSARPTCLYPQLSMRIPTTSYPVTQQTRSCPVPPLSSPCLRAQEILDGFPKGCKVRLESYRGRLYTTFICLNSKWKSSSQFPLISIAFKNIIYNLVSQLSG